MWWCQELRATAGLPDLQTLPSEPGEGANGAESEEMEGEASEEVPCLRAHDKSPRWTVRVAQLTSCAEQAEETTEARPVEDQDEVHNSVPIQQLVRSVHGRIWVAV
jgi:hypothetical protein